MKIFSKNYQPSMFIIAFSLSAVAESAESNLIREADPALLGISLYDRRHIVSVLDGNAESIIEPITDYTYPKAKKSYRQKVRVTKKSKGRPTIYGNDCFS